MLKLPVFLTTITWLLLAAGADAAARCQDGVVENADVEVILSTINNVRAKVLKGEQRNGLSGTFLPQARAMPNLTWDCEAEKEATKVLIFSCNGTGTPAGNPTPSLVFVDSKSMHIAKVLNFHLDEAEFEELTKADGDNVIYNNEPDLLVFASMVREGTTKVGCSRVACEYLPGSVAYSYACVTDQSAAGAGEIIYKRAVAPIAETTSATTATTSTVTTTVATTTTATTTAATTTTARSSTTTATSTPSSAARFPTGENTKCPSDSGMTDELRLQFLNMHNYRRGLLAQGKIARRSGNRYPVAANMARMNYDCGLEAQALSYARQCPYMKSTSADAGENFSRFPASGLYTWADVVNKTVTSWWSVVSMNSIGVGVNAVTFRMFHVGTGIELWSQMAWARTNKLGCSIARCSDEYVTVCRYMEKGNVVRQQVYIPGRLCSMCTYGCDQDGLCN